MIIKQLKVIKQNFYRIVSFNIIIKMQNANRMKPINVTKQSDLQQDNNKLNNIQISNLLSATKPQSNTKRPNKNLLEKYSFQDNDLSKSQDDISINNDIYPQTKQNDNDWLQLSVKEITLFSRQLIVIFQYFIRQTFYLHIQYTIIYNQTSNQPQVLRKLNDKTQTNGNKDLLGNKVPENQNEFLSSRQVRHVKSKLVHGSILQNQGKHLILSLKTKNITSLTNAKQTNQALKSLKLTELQFSLIRVYETSKQGKMLCRQVIPNPLINKEYSIDFWQEKNESTQKQKPIGTMIFQLFSAIAEEPLAKKLYQQQSQYFVDQSQIPEDISQNKNSARIAFQNYTLGVPRKQQNSRNVFDNQSEQDMSQIQPDSHRSRLNNDSQTKTQRFKYQSEIQQTQQNALVFKLNEISRIMDDNLSKSKHEGYSQRQYLAQTTQFLDEINDNNTNSRSKDIKRINNNNSSNNQTKLSKANQKHVINSQNNYTYIENDPQSRFQGNTTNQREHYQSTLEYSKYVNQQIVLKGSPDISPIIPATPRNNFKKTTQNKVKQVQKSKTPKFQQNQKSSQQKQIKSSEPITKNTKQQNKVSPISQGRQNEDQDVSQNNSQWLTQNLPDMDSSNIRYKFDDNDISNIEQTKNMQQLINQIQKIEKQWYQKRVLNRQLKQKVSNEPKQNINQNKKDMLEKNKIIESRQQNNSNCIDLELRKFKIRLDEGTFYNKLIQNLKNKHKVNQTQKKSAQNKLPSDENDKKERNHNKAPKDYIVYLIAHEVDEQSMTSPSTQISQKIQIKIPSQQISDLIQSQKSQPQQIPKIINQNNLLQQKLNDQQNITSQNIRKKIIKDFQKQLYSKVMKIKLVNKKQKISQQTILQHSKLKDKQYQPQKTKTKIIQITLQQQCSSINGQQGVFGGQKNQETIKKNEKNQNISNPNENRISLIGMYPLPITKPQNKGQQTSFYQNLSNEPLSITMYNMKTGNQQGKLCFQLKKGKIDKEIQTFQSLDDLSGNQITQKRSQTQIRNQKNLSVRIQGKQTSIKPYVDKVVEKSQFNLHNEGKFKKQKQLKIDFNFQNTKQQHKSSLSTKKNTNEVQVNVSNPMVKKSEQNKNAKLTLNGPQIKKSINKNNQIQIQNDNQKISNNNQGNRTNNRSRLQKQNQKIYRIESPNAGKIVKNTGQQFSPKRDQFLNTKGQQVEMNKLTLESNIENNIFPQKLNQISVKLPQSQRLIPPINVQKQQRQFQSPTQIAKHNGKNSKNSNRIKTQENSKINSRNKNIQDKKESSCSSYRLMKRQLQQTAGLLQNLKLKAQDFINKVERQKRSQSKNSQIEQTSSVKQKRNKFDPQLNQSETDNKQTSQKKRKTSNLQVTSSVISQIILSSKNRNIDKNYINNKFIASNQNNKNKKTEEHIQQTPYITKKISGNSKILKQKVKKQPFQLKQGGDYKFQSLSYDKSKGSESRQVDQIPIKSNYISKDDHKLITIYFYSIKIKLSSVNGHQRKKSSLSKNNDSHDYFVKIFTDINLQHSQMPYKQSPLIQRCYKVPQLGDDNLYVEFPLIKLKDSQKDSSLSLTGKQSSRVIIELHHLLQDHLNQEMERNYHSYLNHGQNVIDLVTSSPKNHKSLQPIGILSVTFLQLMAQDSFQFKNQQDINHNKSTLINYSNFLYSGQNIVGKININYSVNSLLKNETKIHKKRNSYEQPHVFLNIQSPLSRQNFTTLHQSQYSPHKNTKNQQEIIDQNISNISTSKNTNQLKFKNHLLQRYNENLSLFQRNQNDIRKLRSESGMTKKVSPKRKKQKFNKIQQTQKHSQQSRLVDPLQILKRRGPKPLKLQQKTKSHSHSHHVRLNRPFQTPMNKRAQKQFDSLNSSQSLHFKRQKTTDNYNHVKNSGFSSDHVEIYPRKFVETPHGSQQKIISQKKQKANYIKRKKNTKELKNYNIQSRIYPTQDTRFSQNRRYDGGNIKFGKSSRFNIVDSPQNAVNSEKADFPGPGHYQVKSIFDRHIVKQA